MSYFCSEANRSALPVAYDMLLVLLTTEETMLLLLFITHLAQQDINLHVVAGWHNEFSSQLTPRLEMVMKGIRL